MRADNPNTLEVETGKTKVSLSYTESQPGLQETLSQKSSARDGELTSQFRVPPAFPSSEQSSVISTHSG